MNLSFENSEKMTYTISNIEVIGKGKLYNDQIKQAEQIKDLFSADKLTIVELRQNIILGAKLLFCLILNNTNYSPNNHKNIELNNTYLFQEFIQSIQSSPFFEFKRSTQISIHNPRIIRENTVSISDKNSISDKRQYPLKDFYENQKSIWTKWFKSISELITVGYDEKANIKVFDSLKELIQSSRDFVIKDTNLTLVQYVFLIQDSQILLNIYHATVQLGIDPHKKNQIMAIRPSISLNTSEFEFNSELWNLTASRIWTLSNRDELIENALITKKVLSPKFKQKMQPICF